MRNPLPSPRHLYTCLLLAFACAGLRAGGEFNVRDFGAAGDAQHKDTAALNRATEACRAAGGGVVRVPAGTYLTGTGRLGSHVTLQIDSGATLLASMDPADYPDTASVWEESKSVIGSLIYAEDASGVTVTGRGTLDGQGQVWWRRLELASPRRRHGQALSAAEEKEAGLLSRGRPELIRFLRCKDVLIEHVVLVNSPEWNIHPLLCERVRVDGVSIFAPPSELKTGPSHNTDGINPESCKSVMIANCLIDNGDDCVTLKSGKDEAGRRLGKPLEDVTITNCVMYHGHGGVTIGSEMSGGVRNVTISNCVFRETSVGIRIKSQRGRGGVVEGVVATGIVMQDVPSPFVITTFYSGKDTAGEVHPVDEGTPRYRDFHFSTITARGATTAGSITGLREMAVGGITFTDVHIEAQSGFTCTNADDVRFTGVEITPAHGPSLILRNCHHIDSTGIRRRVDSPAGPLIVSDEASAP